MLSRIMDSFAVYFCLYMSVTLYRQLWTPFYTISVVLACGGFLIVAEFNELYPQLGTPRFTRQLMSVLWTWAIVVAGLMALSFITKTTTQFSRVIIAGWVTGVPLSMGLWRVAFRQALRSLRLRGVQTQTVAIAGSTPVSMRLIRAIQQDPALGLVVRGVYDDRSAPRRHHGTEDIAPYIGGLDLLVEDARQGKVDVVYVALPMRAETRAADLVRKLADTTATVSFVPDFFVFDLLHARWSSVGGVSVLSIFDTPFQGVGGWLKRVEDLVLGVMGLVLAMPLLIAISIGVRLSSPGPILFRQRRYGLSGREIYILKFRTMTVCEDGPNIPQAKKDDARFTKFGMWLRRSSLDELPQLINVVAGSMSLVGPRPHAVAHNEIYRRKIQGYMLRHKVKPGITGWAQVNGWRGETDTIEKMEKRVEHDLYYIQNWSIGLDVRIMFLTVFGQRVRQNAH